MSQINAFREFWTWCFNRNMDSPIPDPEVLLKYNSPIHHTFLLKSFITNGKLNAYLNRWTNNIGVRYIDREDMFYFIKQCVIDFRIKRKEVHYSPYNPKDILFDKMQRKFPTLKPYEISLFCEIIEKSKDRDAVYSAFGIDKPKKERKKIGKKKRKEKISLKEFLKENFKMMEVK